ncbi:CvpA family protein [Rhabdochromatium marinum]|uniref:CvpA family protein n=1 Tax=Rhabdochromatium marinum TaxID=48729 RepID=UPI001902F842|nr:CvpA family protein [Rhabdochromatium marinum]MBK1649605.1 colicin V production CvpA [Rhabdochromatium marinum]
MVWVDYAIIGVIALSAIIGLARGLIREVISLVIWALAVFIAWTFYKPVAAMLAPWVSTPSLQLGLAVVILVVGVLFAGAIFAYILTFLVEKTGLSGTDRLLGLVFGTVRGAVIVALAVFLAALTPLTADPWWRDSQLLVHFQHLADQILALIPSDLTDRVKSI